jgi:hypothetical protein
MHLFAERALMLICENLDESLQSSNVSGVILLSIPG